MKVPIVGEHLGRYEIVRVLGSGAMGQVYAAYDESLGREVALKVLRAKFSDDFERRERFEREAKAIAALDHPNIVTVHSVEEDEGTHFITMQLVEGKTLDELVPEGGMPIGACIDLAVRIVEAVAAAHRKGIVHRDLKPSNVMVADDGRLKVLDFGLAKLRGDNGDVPALADPSTVGLTLEGQIIGTVAYMSPEQAEGRPADHRSDIFSLGVLMYEMATGEAPFIGDTPISVMSSIIKDTPRPINHLNPGLPPHLARIIRTCLAKDPVRRYQTAIDLRNALDDLKAELQSGEFERFPAPAMPMPEPTVKPVRAPSIHPALRTGAIAALLVTALFVGAWWGERSSTAGAGGSPAGADTQPAPVRLTSQASLAGSPSYSPDGSEMVYSSDVAGSMDLWRQEAGGRTQQVTSLPGNETDPDWAPDDSAVAYARNFGTDGIYLISPHGGQPTRLTSFGARPKWSPNAGSIVFEWRGDVWVVGAQGDAEPRPVAADTAGSPHPTWSHDGESIYYWNRTEADVFRVSASGGDSEALGLVPAGQEVAGLAAASDGSFLVVSRGPYGGNRDIWKVALGTNGMPSGAAERLTWPTTDDIEPSLTPDGRSLAYAARRVTRHLWAYDFDPVTARLTLVSQRLTTAADSNYYPAVTTDGRSMVWTAHRTSDQGQLYTMSLDDHVEKKVTTVWDRLVREIGGAFSPDESDLLFTSTRRGSYELWRARCTVAVDCPPTPLSRTEHPERDVMGSWAPNGTQVVFYSNRSGNWDLWVFPLGNGSEARRLTKGATFEMYPTYSPTGRYISYWDNRDGGGGDVWVIDADDATSARPAATSDAQEGWSAWSVDERWLFFVSDRSGSFNIWAQEFGADSEPFQVTRFSDLYEGLPEAVVYTKFAVLPGQLVLPVEERSGGIWMLEGISR